MRISNIVPCSMNNGEGARMVIIFQGCSLNCKGCFSPELQNFNGGKEVSPMRLVDFIVRQYATNGDLLDGITLSGGNPQEQIELASFLRILKSKLPKVDVWMWTGYTMDEIKESGSLSVHLDYLDAAITGRFEVDKKVEGTFYGSSNQEMWRKKNGKWKKD